MGELLASRRAGRKLGLVVLLLIAPALVLWTIYFLEARGTIKALEREQAGLALVEQLAPLYYTDAKVIPAEKRRAIQLAENALQIPRGAQFADAFPAVMNNQKPNEADDLGSNTLAFKAQLDRGIVASKLALEPDEQSSFLIQAVFRELPDLAHEFSATVDHMKDKLADGKLQEAEFRDIMRSLGKLEKTSDSFKEQMSASLSSDTSNGSLNGLRLLNAKLAKNVDELAVLVSNAHSTTGQFAMISYLYQSQGGQKMMAIASHITSLSSAHIAGRLETRHQSLTNKFYLLTALGASLALAGIGLALYLFKRTLLQLDHVEAAKRESDAMANQLAGMNAEMSELNRDLADKMKALSSAQDEILKKGRMEQLGQLTATVAHELRNPLGAVRTSAFLLQRRLRSLNIDAETQFERINKGITRCDNTITQLLDFSRTKKISAKGASLDDWLARCAEDVVQHLPVNVQIECVLGLEGEEVEFDAARLERAVVNLITNASEALVGKNGETKAPNSDTPVIILRTMKYQGWIALSVSDNGPGIAPEHLERIREPLFTTKNFGTGLGVPAVEQIAVQHNGKLTIESTVGAGARFTIWLPSRLDVEKVA
jgi:signal transduction histidine kinase